MDMELVESYCLRVQYKGGGIFHGRLNRGEKPIANKYCEGKLARTLEKELEEPEVVVLEAIDCSVMGFVVLLVTTLWLLTSGTVKTSGCDGLTVVDKTVYR